MDPLLNDLKFTFDDSNVDEDDEDEVYQALITNPTARICSTVDSADLQSVPTTI
jgi:hypothetical protein